MYYSDGMFKGIYNGKQCHLADISTVLSRAWSAGVDRIIVYIFQPFIIIEILCKYLLLFISDFPDNQFKTFTSSGWMKQKRVFIK